MAAASSAISRHGPEYRSRRCAGTEHIGEAQERIARLGRLTIEHVQSGPGKMSRDQGIAEIGFDDQARRETC